MKTLLLAFALGSATLPAQTAPAIAVDPAPNPAHPASIQSFQLPSQGSLLNALMYIAAGVAPHPVAILLHGFPGNEKNLDLAQSMRRAGWDVLYFNYRGSWGSPGDFSFTHSIEDAQSALAYLRDPINAAKFHADPTRIVLVGHSMGGMIANYVAAQDPAGPNQIGGVALISAADMAGRATPPPNAGPEVMKRVLAGVAAGLASEGMAPLAGCTPESLAAELIGHSGDWTPPASATKLRNRAVLIVTSDDGGAAPAHVLYLALKAAGNGRVDEVHIATDHVYSGSRIALQQTVLDHLAVLASPAH